MSNKLNLDTVISDKTQKIELNDGQWVEIKNQIPFGEVKPLYESANVDKDDPLNDLKLAIPILKKAVVGWNLKTEDGDEVEFDKEKIEKFSTEAVLSLVQVVAAECLPDKKKLEALEK